MFHGAEDDYDPARVCEAYIERLRKAGRDAEMTVYPNADHAFDLPFDMPRTVAKGAQTVRACRIVDDARGRLIHAATEAEFSFNDACVQLDPHVGSNAEARESAVRDLTAYLKAQFFQPGVS